MAGFCVYTQILGGMVMVICKIQGIQLLPGEVVHAISMETNDIAGINCAGSHRFHADIWN